MTIVNNTVNDVAATVLPDPPIDPATGLPVPTIAVATAGGVSVIKDDGTVVDITASAGNVWSGVSFENTGRLCAYHKSVKDLVTLTIPSADYVYTSGSDDITYNELSVPPLFNTSAYNSSGPTGDLLPTAGKNYIAVSRRETTSAGEGYSLLYENPTTPANGMVAYTTSTYNTGWMPGDIKGAFLADTDDTDLVGAELVTNGGFDADTDWTKSDGWTIGSGVASIDGTQTGASSLSQTLGSLVAGATYVVQFDVTSLSAGRITYLVLGGTFDDTDITSTGTYTTTMVAGDSNSFFAIGARYDMIGSIDNISVKLADADRSVSANGLVVNGTITRSPVATGAELVGYSGFSA